MKSVSFGWELNFVNNDGANLFCPITKDIIVAGIELDVAFMPLTSPGWGHGTWAEVLCKAEIMPQKPTFSTSPHAYDGGLGATPEFGASQFNIPAPNVQAHGGIGGSGGLVAVILKTWVADPPVASATHRNAVVTNLDIAVPAGSYLVFHMDHMGYQGDVEMQGVLFYK